MDAIAGFVSEFEPGRYSGEDAARLVTWFTRAERLCAAGKTLAATRAAAANCHQTTGQRSAAHWLAGVTGESVGNAVELLRLGETLGPTPALTRPTGPAGCPRRVPRPTPVRWRSIRTAKESYSKWQKGTP